VTEIRENKIITGTSTAIYSDHILFIEITKGANITLKDAQEHVSLWRDLEETLDDERFSIIIDLHNMKSIERDARNFYSQSSSKNAVGVALITSTPLSNVIANFFIGLNNPAKPIKLFSNKNDAIQWLKEIMELHEQ